MHSTRQAHWLPTQLFQGRPQPAGGNQPQPPQLLNMLPPHLHHKLVICLAPHGCCSGCILRVHEPAVHQRHVQQVKDSLRQSVGQGQQAAVMRALEHWQQVKNSLQL